MPSVIIAGSGGSHQGFDLMRGKPLLKLLMLKFHAVRGTDQQVVASKGCQHNVGLRWRHLTLADKPARYIAYQAPGAMLRHRDAVGHGRIDGYRRQHLAMKSCSRVLQDLVRGRGAVIRPRG